MQKDKSLFLQKANANSVLYPFEGFFNLLNLKHG